VEKLVETKLGNLPIRIRPEFFLVAAVFGAGRTTATGFAMWIVASFLSVLAHELGHALVGRGFGLTPSIELNGRGGLTSFGATGRRLPAWQDIAVCLAGPATGFVLGGLIYVMTQYVDPMRFGLGGASFLRDMLWCNIGWGVLNLLPILPLDGGQVARRLLGLASPSQAERNARVLSIAAGVAAGIWAVWSGWIFGALYAAWLVAPSIQVLRAASKPRG
jgi:Zn-dependent protease